MRLPAGAPSARQLLPLVAVVGLAHLALLRSQPDTLVSASVQATPSFATRQVVAQPEPPVMQPAGPAAPAAAPPRAAPRQRPAPRAEPQAARAAHCAFVPQSGVR